MKFASVVVTCLSLLSAASALAVVDYSAIADTNAIVTGIRSDSATTDSVVITANYRLNGVEYAGLYEGSLAAVTTAPTSSWYKLTPVFTNQTVTAATFYGPNTPLFTPSLGVGNVIAVGSYQYAEGSPGPLFDHGMMYVGHLDGSGTWTQIDATSLVPMGQTLDDTIAHSTMGDLVVGDYDYDLITGHAFIYDRIQNTWTNLNPGNTASVTAYGIWQNGGPNSTSYTICGGQGPNGRKEVDKGYLIDYDSVTHALTHYRTYEYKNQPSSVFLVHFDGITKSPTGYNLTGFVTTGGTVRGFFASVPRNLDGTFGEATWEEVFYPGSGVTTGNTVIDNKVLGIFMNGSVSSYLATMLPNQYGVSVSVSKSGSKATFKITNTGNTDDSFDLSRVLKVANSYSGPTPAKPGKPAFTVSYTLGGTNITKALESHKATTGTLASGASVKLVEKVNAKSTLAFKRTIHTTLKAVSTSDPSITDSAKVQLVVQPK